MKTVENPALGPVVAMLVNPTEKKTMAEKKKSSKSGSSSKGKTPKKKNPSAPSKPKKSSSSSSSKKNSSRRKKILRKKNPSFGFALKAAGAGALGGMGAGAVSFGLDMIPGNLARIVVPIVEVIGGTLLGAGVAMAGADHVGAGIAGGFNAHALHRGAAMVSGKFFGKTGANQLNDIEELSDDDIDEMTSGEPEGYAVAPGVEDEPMPSDEAMADDEEEEEELEELLDEEEELGEDSDFLFGDEEEEELEELLDEEGLDGIEEL